MSVRDEILAKRANMSINEIKAAAPEETTKMKIKRVTRKIKKTTDFIGITSGGTTHSPQRGGSAARDFRESNRIHNDTLGPSHSERVQELRNLQAYMRMVDGKGDHDCDHEH